jgi:hypothetical protein
VHTEAMRRSRGARAATQVETLRVVASARSPEPPGMTKVSSGGASAKL